MRNRMYASTLTQVGWSDLKQHHWKSTPKTTQQLLKARHNLIRQILLSHAHLTKQISEDKTSSLMSSYHSISYPNRIEMPRHQIGEECRRDIRAVGSNFLPRYDPVPPEPDYDTGSGPLSRTCTGLSCPLAPVGPPAICSLNTLGKPLRCSALLILLYANTPIKTPTAKVVEYLFDGFKTFGEIGDASALGSREI